MIVKLGRFEASLTAD